MTIAIITLALTNAVAIAGLIAAWLAYRGESRMAVAAAQGERDEERRADAAIAERDVALVARVRADASYASERAAHVETARHLTAALEELHDAKRQELVGAAPGDVPRIVAGMLQARLAKQARAAAAAPGGDGGAAPPDVPVSGTAAAGDAANQHGDR